MASHARLQRPDWVMLGVQHENGVLVFASNMLSQAELRAEYDRYEDITNGPFLFARPLRARFFIEAEMKQYVMIFGADYADAIRRLFDEWSPTDTSTPPPPEIDDDRAALTSPRAIEAGDRRG